MKLMVAKYNYNCKTKMDQLNILGSKVKNIQEVQKELLSRKQKVVEVETVEKSKIEKEIE